MGCSLEVRPQLLHQLWCCLPHCHLHGNWQIYHQDSICYRSWPYTHTLPWGQAVVLSRMPKTAQQHAEVTVSELSQRPEMDGQVFKQGS